MSKRPRWAIKIGGSLDREGGLDNKSGEHTLLSIIEQLSIGFDLLIIPGGGAFADFVRERAAQRNTPDSVAHAQAILSMAQFGHELAEKIKGAKITLDEDEVEKLWAADKIPVIVPYPKVLEDDKIAARWDVTSDTIAARICHNLDIKKLALLKSVDGITNNGELLQEATADNALATDVVDKEFFKHVCAGFEVFVINGRKPERLKELLHTDATVGTKIYD